jgi:hypothetical protein
LQLLLNILVKHPELTFQELKENFSDRLQRTSVVARLEDAQQILTRTGHKRHFLGEDEILVTSNNEKIAVSNQWSAFNINNFIDRARELGYQIEAK